MADALSLVASFASLFTGIRSRRHDEVLQASSLLCAAAYRATTVLPLADETEPRESKKESSPQSMLEERMKSDLKERILKAEVMLRPFQTYPKWSFQQSTRWQMTRKAFYNELRTCDKLIEALTLEVRAEVGIATTLASILATLEKSIVLSEAHTELLKASHGTVQVNVQSGASFNYTAGETKFAKESSQGPSDAEELAKMVNTMYKLALEGLLFISRTQSYIFQRLYERLKGWGLGIFDGTYGLTRMLAENHVEGGRITAFHAILVSILVQIEEILNTHEIDNAAVLGFRDRLSGFLVENRPLQDTIQKSRQILIAAMAEKIYGQSELQWHAKCLEKELHTLFLLLHALESMRDGYEPDVKEQKPSPSIAKSEVGVKPKAISLPTAYLSKEESRNTLGKPEAISLPTAYIAKEESRNTLGKPEAISLPTAYIAKEESHNTLGKWEAPSLSKAYKAKETSRDMEEVERVEGEGGAFYDTISYGPTRAEDVLRVRDTCI